MHLLLALTFATMVGYSASWSPSLRTDAGTATNYIQRSLGEHANNLMQLIICFAIATFIAVVNPQPDLDTPPARRIIGPMLAVSNLVDTYVCFIHVRTLAATRTEAARASHDQFICLCTQYALAAFFYTWGVVYPTIVWFRLRNSWVRLRSGLVVDALVFLTGIVVLWAHGETRYPPGDAPLLVALLGRPAVSLLAAAVFNEPVRLRLSAAAGLYHVQLRLTDLKWAEARRLLRKEGLGEPTASGNTASTASVISSSGVEEESSNLSLDEMQSHHTAKLPANFEPPCGSSSGVEEESSNLSLDEMQSHHTAKLPANFEPPCGSSSGVEEESSNLSLDEMQSHHTAKLPANFEPPCGTARPENVRSEGETVRSRSRSARASSAADHHR